MTSSVNFDSLNEGQCEIVRRLNEPLFVAAGAGSGKTHTLTQRVIWALSEGSAQDGGRYVKSLDEVLLITFTNDAAAEIKERVRGGLAQASAHDPFLLEQSLRVDGAWISTIHSMCSRILRRHAMELGIDPKFTVCDSSVQAALEGRAIEELMQMVQEDERYAELLKAVPLWPAGGTQGYGSSIVGIVRALMSEVRRRPGGYNALFCPNSNETASLMSRVRTSYESIGSVAKTPAAIATLETGRAQLNAWDELAPSQQTPAKAVELLTEIKFPSFRSEPGKSYVADAREAVAEAIIVALYENVQDFAPQLVDLARQVDERFMQLKLERSYLDNDDLISYALRALSEHEEIAACYESRFKLVMIDEFQDTDARQLALIEKLSGPKASHLTTVGDAQQAIYRFRGGDVEVFRARGKRLAHANHVQMDVNYRSDAHVLALVEKSCGDASLLSDFLKLAADGRHPTHTSKFKATACGPRGAAGRMPRICLELVSSGNSRTMSALSSVQIAERFAQYHQAGQPYADMALLLGRTSSIDLYLEALRARGIPCVVTGGSSFATTSEVACIQALLHTLANPHDTQEGLFRLLSSDMFRLDADDFCQLASRTQEKLDAPTKRSIEQSFLQDELLLYKGATPSERLRAAHAVLRRAFSRLGSMPLSDVLQCVVEESGWLARLEKEGLEGESVCANVLAALRYVRDLVEGLGLSPAEAAVEFDLWLEYAKVPPASLAGVAPDAVRVMTIHGSKGLSFPITAVAECWGNPQGPSTLVCGEYDGLCAVCMMPPEKPKKYSKYRELFEVPTSADECSTVADWAFFLSAHETNLEAAEKARLLYVGLTRATDALVVAVPLAEGRFRSELAEAFISSMLDPAALRPGEESVDISPLSPIELEQVHEGIRSRMPAQELEPALLRVLELEKPKRGSDEPWKLYAGGSLPQLEGALPEAAQEIVRAGQSGQADGANSHSFEVYELEPESYKRDIWRPREGVYSYSSAHAQMAREEQEHAEEQASGQKEPSQKAKRPSPIERAVASAQEAGLEPPSDADKATNLGSALHELAQTMVESGRKHDPERLEAIAQSWELSARQRERLSRAIVRWENSDIRREAQSYELARAEVPFFVERPSRFGEYLEGAIDLLCTHGTSLEEALVVDYKTGDIGLTHEEICSRHTMQAEFYASVLMDLGYKRVSCAFVCVELEDEEKSGQPVVVRWEFGTH